MPPPPSGCPATAPSSSARASRFSGPKDSKSAAHQSERAQPLDSSDLESERFDVLSVAAAMTRLPFDTSAKESFGLVIVAAVSLGLVLLTSRGCSDGAC